jgi:putative ABC transport system permease protein
MVMRLLRRVRYWLNPARHAADLDEEMAFHRSMLARRSLGEGGTTGVAFGNATLAREDARAIWISSWLESVWQDVRYAARSVTRQPAFALSAIAIVALGTGATTGVFGLLDGLVVRSLPVEQPHRLVWFRDPSFSYPIFTEVQQRLPVFDGFFGWNMERAYVDWTGEAGDRVSTEIVEATDGFFDTLKVRPAAGRTFGPADTTVAVLSHTAWRRHFGGEPSAIGRTIRVGKLSYSVVGVAPAGFFGVAPGLEPELFLPIAGRHTASEFASPTSSWLHLMGRLKPGLTVEQANAAVQASWPAIMESTTTAGMPPERKAMYLARKTALEPGRTGFSRVRNQFADPLQLLMALVGLLLVIACASVANLLLARGVARRKEIAIRLAIGANRARVFRQLVTEALVLTFTGAAVGLLLASWSGSVIVGSLRTTASRLSLDTSTGWRTLGFTAALAIAVSILSALLPALGATRGDVTGGLKESGQPGAALFRRWSTGKALVAIQVALALVLIAGAAVFGRSLARILAQGSGIEAQRLLVVTPDAVSAGLEGAALDQFHAQLEERMRAVPGVEAAALAWKPPISFPGGSWTQSIAVDGGPVTLSETPSVYFNSVSPGYFATVGMVLRQGRDLSVRDTAASPRVTVVTEALARHYFPGQDPIGHRISIGTAPILQNVEIVGVVQDTKYRTLQEPTRSIAYLPCEQHAALRSGSNRNLVAVARVTSAAAAAAGVREQVRDLDRRVPVRIETVADRIRESTINERTLATLAGGLGILALVLACAGLYGLLAYAVSRHGREIGLRIALGARPAAVLWMVLRESLVLAAIGIAAGLGGALALGRFVRTMLFEVEPTDPTALAAASAVMLLVASGAAFLPARRAAGIDPVVALKRDS